VIGAVPASYPGYASKLPAPYNIDSITRSIDERTVAAGGWVGTFLGSNARIAADSTDDLILNAIVGIPIITYSANLFETESFTQSNSELVQQGHIAYVFGNYRLTNEVPAGGSNFYYDPLGDHYAKPLPVATLNKFDHIPGISRIFDDGVIVIYSLDGSAYYSSKDEVGDHVSHT
jgi:hypothetical protein